MKFVSAGHCNVPGPTYDPGAPGVNGRTEANETVKMRDAVVARLRDYGSTDIITDLNSESLSQYLKRIKPGTGSVVCEFHFNAFNGKASGVEVIVQQDADKMDMACAKELAAGMRSIMTLPFRGENGVKKESETRHGRLGLMRESGIVVLVELCFIDNKDDMASYDLHFNELVNMFARVLHKYDLMLQ